MKPASMMILLAATLVLAPGVQASESNAGAPNVTFAEHIAPLIHGQCMSCHRPDQVGPFSLISYQDVRKRAGTIQAVVNAGYMPPWKPVGNHGQFINERRLTESQIQTINDWVEGGCPEGDPAAMREPPSFPTGWMLGQPDLVVEMNGEFPVPADGPDLYRSFVFEVDLPEDSWVRAIELRPGARSAMHHALFFIDSTGNARRLDGSDGKAGVEGMGFLRGGGPQSRGSRRGQRGGVSGLGGYVPGTTLAPLPGDLARLLPKGSDVIMQTHFHPSGKPEVEKATLALYFADEPPTRQMAAIQLPPLFGAFAGLDIPAGESDYRVADSFTIPVDVEAVGIGGHAHYICRDMKMTATLPDGSVQDLLHIDDWDLDWQDRYTFREPLRLPTGTELNASLVYDNSAENPENPHDPPQRIRWGRQSTDEMGSMTLLVVPSEAKEYQQLQGAVRAKSRRGLLNRFGRRRAGGLGESALQQLDRNGDGILQKDEVPEAYRDRFDAIDANQDGALDRDEIGKGLQAPGSRQ